ncbi:caspase family protein [Flammeovirga sp. OC4]|uniref:caspase family protein n=1 Tax=Flammeovirga sp. OC4 TaxID=1382345 RepID=UPI000694AC5A|nr:caspase family protein [Flammeovirga sp. OC4]
MKPIKFFLYFFITLTFPLLAQENRGLNLKNYSTKGTLDSGKQYALIMGGNNYDSPHWPTLKNAENDAKAVSKILSDDYNMECTLLLSPTKSEFESKLYAYHDLLKPEDQLLVYIAGHGDFDGKYKKDGFIVFKDSKENDIPRNSYLGYKSFKGSLDALPAKDIGLILDICFGGTFNEDLISTPTRGNHLSEVEQNVERYIQKQSNKRSRVYLTSGAKEVVSDGKAGHYSPFCYLFLEILEQNILGNTTPLTLSQVCNHIMGKTRNEPIYGHFGLDDPGSVFFIGGVNKKYTSLEETLSEFEQLKKQAILGDQKAQYRLGNIYSKGKEVTQDYKEALKWYRLSAEQGYPIAQWNLSYMYQKGQGVSQDYKEAVKWCRLSAEQGFSTAQTNLGSMYQFGQGVSQDYKEAVKWYRLSANQGVDNSQYMIGFMYKHGYGVLKDYNEAVKWYRLSAEQGYRMAQYDLGNMYHQGQGVTQDYKEALKWYRLSAEQGYHRAQYDLGNMYQQGIGISKDYYEAVKLFKLSAEQGNAYGQYSLGFMYHNGYGVPKDYNEAIKWYRLSAEQGNTYGQYGLGFMYEYGQGVPKNYNEAIRLYKKAYKNGNEHAGEALKRLDQL